jgi:ABC-type multidrug transport system fused ATPase/permease subunit
MRPPRKTLYLPGAFLFTASILLGLVLTGWSLWGQVEASLLVNRSGEQDIASLRCPLMLASTETGSVSAYFNNPTAEVIHPTVQAVIGQESRSRMASSVLTLAPGEKKQLQWQVGPGDRVFGGLILVNLFETSQRNFPTHQGSCGIPVSPFPALSGSQVFIAMFVASLVGLAGGAALWLVGNSRLQGLLENATNACAALAVLVVADLLLIFSNWWGLGLLVFLITLMLVVVIITQFILFPTAADRGES